MKNLFKNLVRCMLIFLISNLPLSAQVEFGIKAGVNLTNQEYSGYPVDIETQSKVTGVLGLAVNFLLIEKVWLKSGLNFMSIRGVILEPIESDSRIDYFQLPLSVEYQMNNFLIGFGGYYSYGIGGKNEDNGQNLDLMLGETTDDHYSPEDLGLIGCLSYNIESWKLYFEYGLGLKNIVPNEYKETFPSVEINNTYFSLGVQRKI